MKSNFQIIILVVFFITGVLGVLVFSEIIPLDFGKDAELGQGSVVIWGTESASTLSPIFEEFNNTNKTFYVQYVQKFPETFNQDLLEALASGQGPDMFFLPDDLVLSYSNKIFTIPYETYPIASFKANFASAGEVFTTSNGILAFPLTVDPLIMYYNRSVLDANNIIYPPKTWDELTELVPKLTVKDDLNRITKSAIALGQYSNVDHAKDIISAMFMQSGNQIIAERNGVLTSVLEDPGRRTDIDKVLEFYTNFTDPVHPMYSWNKSFDNSNEVFSREDLVFYLGYASEFESLFNRNPNQNFFVAPMPQIKDAQFKLTGAQVTGVAISAFSKNFNTAFIAASRMATGDFAQKLAIALNIAPARRDLLAQAPKDAYSPTFYSGALYARSWLDPSPKDTDNIFRSMIDNVLSNKFSPVEAIKDASSKLSLLLIK
ncbi:extracellular solute-binding protein [Candidatus Nomurabacteria bacterium]|nr:extracellular solute-binding protein [Candidatus Nomurabacteria bacterium]